MGDDDRKIQDLTVSEFRELQVQAFREAARRLFLSRVVLIAAVIVAVFVALWLATIIQAA